MKWVDKLYDLDELETIKNFLWDVKEDLIDQGKEPSIENVLEVISQAEDRRTKKLMLQIVR
jgi:hypothetical protein